MNEKLLLNIATWDAVSDEISCCVFVVNKDLAMDCIWELINLYDIAIKHIEGGFIQITLAKQKIKS
jgi:hypothetical protein